MTNSSSHGRSIAIGAVIVAALVFVTSVPVPVAGVTVGARFIASLRTAKPTPVTAPSIAAAAGGARQLHNVVLGILAETTAVATDEPDFAAPSIDSATRAAGFTPRLVRARTDAATLSVIGAHSEDARVNRDQLRTLLIESGRRSAIVAASLDGASVALTTPRRVRSQYGHCPAPVSEYPPEPDPGPPPPTGGQRQLRRAHRDPRGLGNESAGLDTGAVVEIALELTGMSPNQTRDTQRSLARGARALTAARHAVVRHVESHGAPAMLINTAAGAGRRTRSSGRRTAIVYHTGGLRQSADALPLAKSLS